MVYRSEQGRPDATGMLRFALVWEPRLEARLQPASGDFVQTACARTGAAGGRSADSRAAHSARLAVLRSSSQRRPRLARRTGDADAGYAAPRFADYQFGSLAGRTAAGDQQSR